MSEADWTYESKHTILRAGPELQESFRAATRAKFEEDYGSEYTPDETEVEEMTAFAWSMRAKEVCAKADLLIEEGVPDVEVKNILKIEPLD
jgi:hypothetical protein